MPQPTPYDRQTSFALYSAEFPGEPHSGVDLDNEFNTVKVTTDEIGANLALIQADDGALARGIVGNAQLDSSIVLGFGPPSVWEADTEYVADIDTVFHVQKFYMANTTHTSGVTFDATKWDELADFSTSHMLDPGSVTNIMIADGAITTEKIEPGAVESAALAAGIVTTVKIADAAVTVAKLAPDVPAALANLIFPAGFLAPFAGTAAPTGWQFCYGQEIVRADFPSLFAAVGVTYGAGNGTTTFNLPDMRGRAAIGRDDMGGFAAGRITDGVSGITGTTLGAAGGSESHTLIAAEMPAHDHVANVSDPGHTHTFVSSTQPNNLNAGVNFGFAQDPGELTGASFTGITVDVTDAGGGGAHRNVQPSLVTNYIIKAH